MITKHLSFIILKALGPKIATCSSLCGLKNNDQVPGYASVIPLCS